ESVGATVLTRPAARHGYTRPRCDHNIWLSKSTRRPRDRSNASVVVTRSRARRAQQRKMRPLQRSNANNDRRLPADPDPGHGTPNVKNLLLRQEQGVVRSSEGGPGIDSTTPRQSQPESHPCFLPPGYVRPAAFVPVPAPSFG